MSLNDKMVKPPTSGSALLQFVAAALRSESMVGSQADFPEEDDDMVHIDDEGKENVRRMLFRQESTHGLGIHSDGEEEDFSDEEPHVEHPRRPSHHSVHQQHQLLTPDNDQQEGSESDISKSTSPISFGSSRDKKTVAEKLQAAFGYPEVEEFVGEYSCWLARSVLLPGYMYLTSNHICFYANLPSSQDVIQKEGFFSKKSRTTKQFTRYWFILKNDVLSYYGNQTDVYYPIKTVDLKNALSAEPSPNNDQNFYIFTNNRKYTFRTDSELAKADWVKAIQKSIFHAKMEGDKVKISIPLANVLDVEMNTMAFAEAIQVKVMESDGSFAVDEYYFAYFNETAKTLHALKTQVKKYQLRSGQDPNTDHRIYDSTSPSINSPRRTPATTSTTMPEASHRPPPISGLHGTRSLFQSSTSSKLNSLRLLHPEHTRSPSRSTSPAPKSQPTSDTEDTEKEKSRHALSFSIRGTTSWIADHRSEGGTGDESMTLNEKEQEAFRKEFSLPTTEGLSAVVIGYLLRIVPLYGRVYLSDNYLCYKSKIVGTRTQVIVPLADIERVDKHKGTRFYFHGLSVLTKTDEEIFFEFSTTETRNTILNTLRDRITPEAQERRMKLRAQAIAETPSVELDDPMEYRIMDSMQLREEPVHVEPMSWASHPGFKPTRPLHITCLTIGSRGDVQPYIALCKRLMQDGHSCRISTHGEYKDWIEGHGIEFGLVGGDPGELIELCVENGMFTVSFIREGLKRFRGWLDELMETAWTACQGTDVLIESPSAMAGIHIAEKLDIPYFRAFPFPWTRTRAFPHPFAVPEHNLGRGYNYMTYVMIEQVFWKGISGQINKWRKDTLGLGPSSLEKQEAHRVPSLYSWSPNVVPAPMDWHSWIHVTGYWFLDNPDLSWTPPEDLVQFLKADPENKPVYIGFGSMVVPDPDGMTRAIIEAVVKSGVRAIISKGWSDRLTSQDAGSPAPVKKSEEIVYPPSVYMLKSVPHDWLFPQLSGCVHHGGAGTTAAGLRAGIPTVIKPYFGDQYFWAQRVEEAGVGVWCHDLSVKKLTSALVTITTDEKMIRKAQSIGEKIRSEDGVGTAVQYFYHDLSLAKDRLNRHRKDKSGDTPVKFKVQEGEDDWWFVQPSSGVSGATSANEGSESTNLNVLSGSEEESVSTPSDGVAPHVEAFMDLHHSASYQSDHVQAAYSEPLTHQLHYASTEPGPDRATEAITHSEDTAEGLAAQLEALQPPSQSPVPSFAQAYAQGEGSREKELHRPTSSNGSTSSSKASKRTSTARKVIESLTTKATGYFSPSHLQSHSPPPSSSGDGRQLHSHASSGSTSTITSNSVYQEQGASTSSDKCHKSTASTSSIVLGGAPPSSKDASKTLIGNTHAHTLR
ncbi:sterol 3beta-glucosyltransferase [Entomortierella parvispora]|uniref:sterol 3beta-glucosyltransferase n=1 Tax=Entomortierella parvispora TaxID=205924 RepID=A0A9P3H8I8_9FUNG|nr:sterol 3beta-glucosyltransferase [Entomortierella parvispora]